MAICDFAHLSSLTRLSGQHPHMHAQVYTQDSHLAGGVSLTKEHGLCHWSRNMTVIPCVSSAPLLSSSAAVALAPLPPLLLLDLPDPCSACQRSFTKVETTQSPKLGGALSFPSSAHLGPGSALLVSPSCPPSIYFPSSSSPGCRPARPHHVPILILSALVGDLQKGSAERDFPDLF